MKLKLHTQILIGIAVGVLAGILFQEKAEFVRPIGTLFIRALRMMIVPLVFSSLVMAIVSLGNIKQLGKLGARTFLYYFSTTSLAVVVGLLCVNLLQPGLNAQFSVASPSVPSGVQNEPVSIGTFFSYIIPDNILKAAVEGEILAVIFFSMLFGAALIILGRKGEPLVKMIDGLDQVMLQITDWIMKLAPFGVAALLASLIGRMGVGAIKPLALFMLTVLIGLAIHVCITLFSLLVSVGRYSPVTLIQRVFPALATAFSTASSLATLPVTMECLEKNVGVSGKVTGFVAPLGASVGRDGTALYEAVSAVFIAQVFGIELSLVQQVIILLTATLTSIGAAGIPGASLVTIVIVLRSVNLPLEGIGLILAVDRLLDMFRTTVNVFGHNCGTAIIARLEGEKF